MEPRLWYGNDFKDLLGLPDAPQAVFCHSWALDGLKFVLNWSITKDIRLKKVALIYGGTGAEAKVSATTSEAFAQALIELGLQYVKVEANHDLAKRLTDENPDVALLALHGKWGEDGTVQGVCEYLKIPYSGSGVLSSALCMDKAFCKMLFEKNNIPSAKYQVLDIHETPKNKFTLELSYPVVVKPSREGSSVGVSIVENDEELHVAIDTAEEYDHIVLIEKFIEGKEVTVPIMGERTLASVEIAPKHGFYNYENKYTTGNTNYIIPANVEKKTLDRINEIALKCSKLVRNRSYARVDFMVDRQGNPFVMEVNTLPGCTPTSLVPKSAAKEGIAFKDFIKFLLDMATTDYAGLK